MTLPEALESRETLVLGSGLLGSAVSAALVRPVAAVRPIRWGQPEANADIARAVESFLAGLSPGRTWGIAWCAGAGFVGTDSGVFAREIEAFRSMCGAIERSDRPGKIVIASSAGAVYGGCGASVIDEFTAPASISAYGDARLVQEQLAAAMAGRTSSRVLIARISNLYGANQRLDKPQGAISHLLRSLLLRRPFVLNVPIDTQRDYIDAETVGRRLGHWLEQPVGQSWPSDSRDSELVTTKLIVSGRAESLARLVTVAHAVSGVRPRIVSTVNVQSSFQPRSLRFVSRVGPSIDSALPARSLEEGVGNLWRRMLDPY